MLCIKMRQLMLFFIIKIFSSITFLMVCLLKVRTFRKIRSCIGLRVVCDRNVFSAFKDAKYLNILN